MDSDSIILSLRNLGLLGAFESLAEWCGERTAVLVDPKLGTNPATDEGQRKEREDDGSYVCLDDSASDQACPSEQNIAYEADSIDSCSEMNENNGSGGPSPSLDDYEGISIMELQFAARSLARQLRLRFGVRRGDNVLLVCRDETPAEIVGMLAVIQLGACFIPIAPEWVQYRSEHLISIIEDAHPAAAVVVANNDEDENVVVLASVSHFRCAYISPDGSLVEYDASVSVSNEEDPKIELSWWDEYPLYILYTSGSTGRPKGVLGTHRGLVNRILWAYDRFPWRRDEVACRRTPLTFVDSLAETFAPLLAGVPIWPCPRSLMRDRGLLGIASLAQAAGVTRITLLPNQIFVACKSGAEFGAIWPKLRIVVISGEECHAMLVGMFQKVFPKCMLINLYGSTEVAGDVSFAVLVNPEAAFRELIAGPVSIGSAITGNAMFVVSRSESGAIMLTPDGEPGELLVVGEHVALGYYNRNEETAAKFVRNPFRDRTRSSLGRDYDVGFLTGDLVCEDSRSLDKNMSFTWLGRIDRMLKVRGIRVELEGLERCIFEALGICDGCALVGLRSDDTTSNNNHSSSIALCVDSGVADMLGCSDGNAVRCLIQSRLESASYPLPAFVLLFPGGLPRTTSGKVNRTQLLLTISKHSENVRSLLGSNIESSVRIEILNIYFDILPFADLVLWENSKSYDGSSVANLDPRARLAMLFERNFYDFGGDSMSGVMASWKLRERFGDTCAPKDVLKNSIIEIADLISMDPDRALTGVADNAPSQYTMQMSKRRRYHSSEELFPLSQDDDPKVDSLRQFPLDFRNNIFHNISYALSDQKCVSSLKFEWQSTLNKCIDSSPLLVFDAASADAAVVYVGSHAGDFCCLDANNGQIIWRYNLGGHMEGACALLIPPKATGAPPIAASVIACAYAGNDVDGFEGAVGTGPGERGDTKELGLACCLNAASGILQWRRTFPGEIKAAPCVDDSLCVVYLACYDQYLYAVDGKTGVILGKVCCHGSMFSCPALYSSQASATIRTLVCATTQGSVLIIESTFLSHKTHLVVAGVFSAGAPIFARPIIMASGQCDWPQDVIVGAIDGSLRCLSISRQISAPESPVFKISEEWKISIAKGALFSSPCLVESSMLGGNCVIFGSHDGRMRCVEAKTGLLKWETDLGSSVFASPVCLALQRNQVDAELMCFVCTTSGYFVVLDAVSGSALRSLRLPGEVYSSVAVAATRPGAVVGCRDNRLHCIRVFEDN
jgi:acyl-CoA synthetase (AMP-forming)/AMP-acid ligase II/outer membrane protein assembly factor BamB